MKFSLAIDVHLVYNYFVKGFDGKAALLKFDERDGTPWAESVLLRRRCGTVPELRCEKADAQTPPSSALRSQELNSRWNRVNFAPLNGIAV